MDQQTLISFVALVFGTVFLLSQLIIVPTFGTERQERKRLARRLTQIAAEGTYKPVSLVREQYLKQLSPLERWLDSLPGAESLNRLIEQSGQMYPAYRLLVASLALGVAAGFVTWNFSHHLVATAVLVAVGLWLPYGRLTGRRRKRLDLFEQQLPEALDLMVRALRAGHPFDVAMSFIGKEMDDPVGHEFGLTFDEIRYGREIDRAFLYLIDRVPSMSLMGMATAIFIQRETGGNLSEVLQKISSVLRSRFRFRRRVKTLSAEGRISAWVLALIPFLLFGALTLMNPDYMDSLTGSEQGRSLLTVGVVLLTIGILWINQLIKIRI